jgi:hypothetical protein
MQRPGNFSVEQAMEKLEAPAVQQLAEARDFFLIVNIAGHSLDGISAETA